MAKFSTGNIDFFFNDLVIHILNVDGTKTLRHVEGSALIEYSASTYDDDATGETWEVDFNVIGLSDIGLTDHQHDPVNDTPDHYDDLIFAALEERSAFDIECQIVDRLEY